MWRATQQEATAGEIQTLLHQIGTDRWIRRHYRVVNPGNEQIAGFTSNEHNIFLGLVTGQVITAISPPVFIWASPRRLTGTWCIIATTYHEGTHQVLMMTESVRAGAVPLAALDW